MNNQANKVFTSLYLSLSRAAAKEASVVIPKGLTTYRPTICGTNPYYEVWADTGLVWQGHADNANDAKAKYIGQLLQEK